MPYLKLKCLPQLKMGISPSVAGDFDMKNLTATQKVMLASSRIFGYTFGGLYSSGSKQLMQSYRK